MKRLLLCLAVAMVLLSCVGVAQSRFELGIKMQNIREEITGGYNVGLVFDYAQVSMDFLIVRGFGFLSVVDLTLRMPWMITPTVGVGFAWGNEFFDGPFFETNGFFVGVGLQYVNEGYTFSLGGKTYVTWDGGISTFPVIEASFRIKVGEW